ncbi:acyltransferase [Methylobacterium radiotolerans]|nr:acyltransferase [Methylobacterium radiotolerans]
MHRNSFDALRALAAGGVIVSHAFQITSGTLDTEPLHRISRGQLTLGDLCVAAFMVISGYLVTGSWVRRPDAKRFLTARALRLLPALAVVVLALIALGGLLTTAAGYWTDPGTWSYLRNILLHAPQQALPGVFEGNPLPLVNGSLWTLEYEVACYLILLVAGLAGLARRWLALPALLALAVGFLFVDLLPQRLYVWLPACFLAGATLYLWQDRIRWSGWLALGGVALVILGTLFGGMHAAVVLGGAYALVYAGRSTALSAWGKQGDPSYGVYLWGWPVQQILMQAGVTSPALNAALALAVAFALGFISWHLIEKPALALIRRPKTEQVTVTLS